MSDLTDELAYGLHGAIWDYSKTGHWPIAGDDFPACEVLAQSVMESLGTDGYRIVKAIKPHGEDQWGNPQWGNVVTAYPKMEYAQLSFGSDHEVQCWYPESLRALAGSLLAAADLLEGKS